MAEAARVDAEGLKRMLRERRYAEARSACERALADGEASVGALPEPERKAALQTLGTCHYFEGRIAKSIECFERLLAIDPKNIDASVALSVMYNDIGRYDEARKIYRVANESLKLKRPGADLLLDRRFSLRHVELGDLYLKFHRHDDAVEEYAKAIRLDPGDPGVRIKLAKAYARKGYATRALQELQAVCHQYPDFSEGRVQLGLMYFSQGNVIDAQLEWEAARAHDPGNAEIQSYLDMARRSTETTA